MSKGDETARAEAQAASDQRDSVRSGTDSNENFRAEQNADRLEQKYGLAPREDRKK